jgi:hypothetical protein
MIDPALRYLPGDVLIDDTLRVGSLAVQGESPRAAEVRATLDAGRPVAGTGVRWVLVQREAGAGVPAATLAGLRPVYQGDSLDLYANPAPNPPSAPDPVRRWLLAVVDLAVLAMVIVAGWQLLRRPTAW